MNRLESSLTLYTGYLGDMHPTVRGILKSLLEVATDLDMPSACRRYKKRIEKAAAQEASLPVKSPEIHAAAGPRSCACSCHDHTPAGIAWRAPVPHFFSLTADTCARAQLSRSSVQRAGERSRPEAETVVREDSVAELEIRKGFCGLHGTGKRRLPRPPRVCRLSSVRSWPVSRLTLNYLPSRRRAVAHITSLDFFSLSVSLLRSILCLLVAYSHGRGCPSEGCR